jgi:hypothetical protein
MITQPPNTQIDQLNTMYPCAGYMYEDTSFSLPNNFSYYSVYGYCYRQADIIIDGTTHSLAAGQYFAFSVNNTCTGVATGKLFLVVRLGYRVPSQIGWVEQQGRLSYIDGCSDSLLVYPARLGDSSLNLLYFPPGIDQTFHRHPSIRIGCVIDGHGISEHGEQGNANWVTRLDSGVAFSLLEHERHRFCTRDSSMTIIAFHPDGDWGPTDHNHTMLNRTYLTK